MKNKKMSVSKWQSLSFSLIIASIFLIVWQYNVEPWSSSKSAFLCRKYFVKKGYIWLWLHGNWFIICFIRATIFLEYWCNIGCLDRAWKSLLFYGLIQFLGKDLLQDVWIIINNFHWDIWILRNLKIVQIYGMFFQYQIHWHDKN